MIGSLSQLSHAGMLTFVDLGTGSIVRVPWRAGVSLYGGSLMAQLPMANRAVAVVRAGKLIYTTVKALSAAGRLQMQPGDVIRLTDALS